MWIQAPTAGPALKIMHSTIDFEYQVSSFPICVSLVYNAIARAARNQTTGIFCLIKAQLYNFPMPPVWWTQVLLSNFLLEFCCHFQHLYIKVRTGDLPLSWPAGFASAFSCSLEHRSSAWPGLSHLWLMGWDAPDCKQKPGTQIKDLMEMPGVDSLWGLSSWWHKLFLSVSINTLQQQATFGSPQLTMSLRRDIFVPFTDGLHNHWLVKSVFSFLFVFS